MAAEATTLNRAAPAQIAVKRGQKTQASFEMELASRIFVKLYDPGGGRTAEHYARQAVKAAQVFMQTYQQDHR